MALTSCLRNTLHSKVSYNPNARPKPITHYLTSKGIHMLSLSPAWTAYCKPQESSHAG